ncbi:hypothetical protein [Clostridium ganghwense]|uniref:Uncharacterized protein n=1 Tax=Clostridium ganghwense TaxID=312089 RepID=A0ABT4CMG4_9CLOT|nr:hypothetical protein [Clostridium ganghwense]MCY6370128.1 hypothetical protein [Clostridium ganghwense]
MKIVITRAVQIPVFTKVSTTMAIHAKNLNTEINNLKNKTELSEEEFIQRMDGIKNRIKMLEDLEEKLEKIFYENVKKYNKRNVGETCEKFNENDIKDKNLGMS